MAIAILITFMVTVVVTLAWATTQPSAAESSRTAPTARQGARVPVRRARPDCSDARRGLIYYQRQINEWRARMGAGRVSPEGRRAGRTHACPHVRRLARQAQHGARAARRAFGVWFRRTYAKWACIHEHEGSWTANTGNGYNGGLQMDSGFQHTYGPEFIRRYGLAHQWPVWAQLVAAERAFYGFAGYGGRGYSPWGTRGMCGV